MRAFVFTDKALERYAGRFVWLSVDIENAANAKFLQKYPISEMPTLLVVDPRKESVVLRYSGGATVPQLEKLLDSGQQTFRARSLSESDKLLANADRFSSNGMASEAIKSYELA